MFNPEDSPPKTEKKQNTLAVFEHLKCNEPKPSKIPQHRRSVLAEDSDNELSQEEDKPPPKRKRFQGVRLLEEPMNLKCLWNRNGCDQTIFTDYDAFVSHVSSHVRDLESYACLWDTCNTHLPDLVLLEQHVIYHAYLARIVNIGRNVLERLKLPECQFEIDCIIPMESNGYKCEWCGYVFWTIYLFYQHIRAHVICNPKYCKKGEIIKCQWKDCTCKFSSQYRLSEHMRGHSKEKIIACPTCLTMFASKTAFNDHHMRQLPIDLQSYQCSQCSKLFPSERLLRDHMRSHINLYKCTMCDMTCSKPSALKMHMKYRHLEDRPFKCNMCGLRSVSKQALDTHLLTHIPDKMMTCDMCDFKCKSMMGLGTHYQVAHDQGWSRTYECHCCNKQFPVGRRLTLHLKKQHNFHWPSGHSRFRYKKDPDGIYRLQTVRYESIEVTQEIIGTNNPETTNTAEVIHPEGDVTPKYVIQFEENGEKNVICPTENRVVIAIKDIDESGRVVNSQVVQSSELKLLN